jgi:hypothetical protein
LVDADHFNVADDSVFRADRAALVLVGVRRRCADPL